MGENDKAAKILKTKEFAAFLIEIMNYLGINLHTYNRNCYKNIK